MGQSPGKSVVNAIENGVAQVTRRVAVYETDGVTPWNPSTVNDPGFTRLVDGSITLDYSSDERRKIELTLLNDDGLLRLNPRGGFYYDKVIRPYRGVRYSPKLTAPPVALAEFDGTFQQKVNLTRQVAGLGYELVDMTAETTASAFDQYTVVMVATFSAATTRATLLRDVFRSGRSVVTIGQRNGMDEIPFVATVSAGTSDWGLSPANVDSPIRGSVTGSTGLGTTAGVRVTGLSVWGQAVSVWSSADGTNHITATIGTNSKSASWLDLHVPQTTHQAVIDVLGAGLDYMRRKSDAYVTWEYPLGDFMIDGIADQTFPDNVKITGRDYTKKLLTDKLDQATTFRAGTSLKNLITAVASNGGITKFRVAVGNEMLPSDTAYDRGTDRWEIIKTACTSFGYESFFDNEGYLVVRMFLDPYRSPLSHTFKSGPDGNIIDYSRTVNDSRIYNIVNVYGDPADQNSGQLPFFGQAVNDDPNSPTSTVKIGKRPTSFASVFYTSNQQCVDTARNMLAVSALESYEANFSSLYYPWLEVGEIVEIQDPNGIATDPTRFLMDTLSLPLGLAPMTGTAKRVTVVGNAGTPS